MLMLNTILDFVWGMATVFRLIYKEQHTIINWPQINDMLLLNTNMGLLCLTA
jgi:hypothetical protein